MTNMDILGQHDNLSVAQMALRSALVFCIGYILLRIGGWKIFGKKSALDYVIIIVMGSILAKIIIGDTAFFPGTMACLVMVLLSRCISGLCARYKGFSHLIEGRPLILYGEGRVFWENMIAASVSYKHLMQSLRLEMNTEDLQDIEVAQLESSGRISFIVKSDR